MARVISDECVSCGTCEGECPVGAIAMGADHYEVNADTASTAALASLLAPSAL